MVFFILLLCASLPPSMISAELIGVARTTGPAQINGMSLPGQVNVFSGDRIGTGQDSTLSSFHPSAIDFRKGFEVVLDGQHLGLKSTHGVGAGGILLVDRLSGDPPHRRINR